MRYTPWAESKALIIQDMSTVGVHFILLFTALLLICSVVAFLWLKQKGCLPHVSLCDYLNLNKPSDYTSPLKCPPAIQKAGRAFEGNRRTKR